MIELTILEAVKNIEKYSKTKAWKKQESGWKRNQYWRFGVEKKEELGEPKETS
jgi:hypothetical protein